MAEIGAVEVTDSGLSESAKVAHWVDSPNEHTDRIGQTLMTRNHEVIRAWVEERGGRSAILKGTELGSDPSVLRIDFSGGAGDLFQEVGWNEWFKPFDERKLAFVFQEKKEDGSRSSFFRIESVQSGS